MTPSDLAACKQLIRDAQLLLRRLQPSSPTTPDQLAQADEIVAGQIRFNARHGGRFPQPLLNVGRRQIDWRGGHLHHQEWPTQLGRFFMLMPLMAAYHHTQSLVYGQAARDYIEDWMDHVDPTNIEMRGNTCMDIGIRLGTHDCPGWRSALALWMDSPAWDDAFVLRVLASIEQQAHILWKQALPSRPWGNHRIYGLDSLLHVCIQLPFCQDAPAMLQAARRSLAHAARQQFLEDGAHIEQTLGYHLHMVDTFVYLHQLSLLHPLCAIDLPVDRLLKAADYALHTWPGGINDTMASLQERPDAPVWQRTRAWRDKLQGGQEPDWQPPREMVFPCAGQVFARSSWAPQADYLAFDAGPYSGGHAHLARLGLVYRCGGRLWIADPGMFDYEMSNPFALYGRSTAAHSTLNLNGLNQGPCAACLQSTILRDDLVFLHGVYEGGYWSGTYSWTFQDGVGEGIHGRHERMVLWIRDAYLLVLDSMTSDPGHSVESVWQMGPVQGWRHDPQALSWQSTGEDVNFHLQMVLPIPHVHMDVLEGQQQPRRGWFCEQYAKQFTPAPQIVLRYPSQPIFGGMLAMPLRDGLKPPKVTPCSTGCGRGIQLTWADGHVDLLAIADNLSVSLEQVDRFATDAALLWLRMAPDGSLMHHFMLDGTYLNHSSLA